jgi:hypothetical protein
LSGVGSADERALVLLTLLRQWGIAAASLWLPSADTPDPTPTLATPDRLNELVVFALPAQARPLLLDPACLGCAPGELTLVHQDREGLLAMPADEINPHEVPVDMALSQRGFPTIRYALWRTPSDAKRVPPIGTVLAIEQTDRGFDLISGRLTAQGSMAAALRQFRYQQDDTTTDDSLWRGLSAIPAGNTVSWQGLDVDEATTGSARDVAIVATVGRSPFAPVGVALVDGVALLPLNALVPVPWLARFEAMRLDLTLEVAPPLPTDAGPRGPTGFYHDLSVILHPGTRVLALPSTQVTSNAAGTYTLVAEISGQSLRVREELILHANSFSGDLLVQLAELCQVARLARNQAIIVARDSTTLLKLGADSAPRPDQ